MSNKAKHLFILTVTIPLLVGCSSFDFRFPFFNKKPIERQTFSTKDYLDHLTFLGTTFLKSTDTKKIKLSKRSRNYIEGVLVGLVTSNELVLSPKIKNEVHIIKSKYPYHFSVPGGSIFISSELIKRYIDNEQFLVSVLSYELIRSHRGLYLGKVVVPTGLIGEQKIISLTNIPLSVRFEVSKWAYFVMKRSNYDEMAYLTWIQILNRNSMDFIMQYSDPRETIKIESMLKQFVVTSGGRKDEDRVLKEYVSPRGFYQFRREIKRKVQ